MLEELLPLGRVTGGKLKKVIALMILIASVPVGSLADTPNVPEINPASAMSALALLSGGLLVLRGYLKK